MAEYEALPVIEGIDWEQGYKNLSDMDLLFSVLTEFCVNADREMSELTGYYDTYFETGVDEAMENYRIKVHALKNSAALIGAQSLSDDAKALEYASRDREVDIVKRDNAAFVSKYIALASVVAETFDIDMASGTVGYDADEFKTLLQTLKEAFDSFDIENLNDTMEKIEAIETEPEMAVYVVKLSGAVLTLDENEFNESIEALYKLI